MHVNALIVGAGFSGLTYAERLAAEYKLSSLIVEKRRHIGGNAYDRYDDHGVLVHNYGPHYFRTNSERIRDYLSRFTGWHAVDYQILIHADGVYWPFPINLNTFEQFIGRPSNSDEMVAWLEEHRVPILTPQNSEEVVISQVGWALYEKFFRGYTQKQWQCSPKDLDPSVCGRIPIRTNRDDRYLDAAFQALPKAGYTKLFENMLAACGQFTKVLLNTDLVEVLPHISFDRLVYTGPIDAFFDHCHGPLAYRSLRFEEEHFTGEQLLGREPIARKKGFWQPAMQVNYPNDEAFTRIVEIKHATGQRCEGSTIVREYPQAYGPKSEPFYPVPAPGPLAQYQKYQELTCHPEVAACLQASRNRRETRAYEISFIGRLATYRYYNMDQVVGMSLAEFDRNRPSWERLALQ